MVNVETGKNGSEGNSAAGERQVLSVELECDLDLER